MQKLILLFACFFLEIHGEEGYCNYGNTQIHLQSCSSKTCPPKDSGYWLGACTHTTTYKTY